MPRTPRDRSRAFTLVELTMTMLIMVVVMGGLTSALLLATHALPNEQGTMQTRIGISEALDGLAGELLYATSITESSGDAVTFTVADRNHGDPGPETIRYAWSGTEGDPLTRQCNEGTAVVILEDVTTFELEYDSLPDTQELVGIRVNLEAGHTPTIYLQGCVHILNCPEAP